MLWTAGCVTSLNIRNLRNLIPTQISIQGDYGYENNYFIAKRNFDENWENLSRVYAEAGMSPEAIQEMHDYDWAVFREQRN